MMKIGDIIYLLSVVALSCFFFFASPKADDTVFKAYDLRGVVDKDFQVADCYDIARAIGTYFSKQAPDAKTVALGMDGRIHSAAIKQHIVEALVKMGFDVIFIGTCTTPILYFAQHVLNTDAALMITASHNPAEYNGIKICLHKQSVYGAQIEEIREIYKTRDFSDGVHVPGVYSEHPVIPLYIDWLAQQFPHLVGMDISAIIDCGNGAAGTVMPQLVEKMNWTKIKLMYAEVDGTYPHHVADPTVEKYMEDLKKELASSDAALGLAFDGDADRMAPMTKTGKLVSGDRLLAIFSEPILKKNPGRDVVFDVSASSGLIQLLELWGAKPVMSATGHTNIKASMKKANAVLGGEISCHFVFNDRPGLFGYDDGIYSALRLFEILQETGKSLDELLAVFPDKVASPTYRIPCEHEKRAAIISDLKTSFGHRDDAELVLVDGVRVQLPYGWAIVRMSNTEPMLSMRFEGDDVACLGHIKHDFAHIMKDHLDCSFLEH